MAEPNDTLRPVSPTQEVEETTPLLAADRGESSNQNQEAEQTETAPLPSSDAENLDLSLSASASQTFAYIKRSTYVSLVSSVIGLILLLATFFTSALSPYHSWVNFVIQEMTSDLGLTILLSLILTILNLTAVWHPYPPQSPTSVAHSTVHLMPRSTFFYLPITLIADLVLPLFIFGLAGRLSSEALSSYYCRSVDDPDIAYRLTDCERWWLALRILCGLSVVTVAVNGLAHLTLFVLRTITALRYGPWSRASVWNIPTTGISVQLTIKILGRDSVNTVES